MPLLTLFTNACVSSSSMGGRVRVATWPLLRPTTALEILAHRVLWSLLVVVVLLVVTKRSAQVLAALRDRRRAAQLALAAVVIAVNWGTYIYGVSSDRVVEPISIRITPERGDVGCDSDFLGQALGHHVAQGDAAKHAEPKAPATYATAFLESTDQGKDWFLPKM